jgi:6-phosphogluconate dehydrogenase
LLLDDFFKEKITTAQPGWRRVTATSLLNGTNSSPLFFSLAHSGIGFAVPALTTALCYFDGIRTARSPHNLLQAQRDYFGAHTYERVDKPAGEWFHTNWTGRGAATSSSQYVV